MHEAPTITARDMAPRDGFNATIAGTYVVGRTNFGPIYAPHAAGEDDTQRN